MDWTCEVVAKLHYLKMEKRQLAAEAGYSPVYLSMLLNGRRYSKAAEERLLSILNRKIEQQHPVQ